MAAATSLALIGLLVLAGKAAELNPASAGFLMLVGVLFIASRYPLIVATSSAVLATLSYNFFFFPPTLTFTIEDPDNWVALATFLATSLLANRLLVRERRQAASADASRGEIGALYALSVDLLRASGGMDQAGAAAARYVDRIGAASGGVILFGASAQHQRVLAWTGAPITDEVEEIAAGVGRHGRVTDIPSRFGRDICLPLVVGGKTRGTLFVRGVLEASSAIESAATLLSFAIERERFLEERARVAALRESHELKSSLLQAVSHDLKSPLTVLGVVTEALELKTSDEEGIGHVRAIRSEVAKLHRRIDNLLTVARIEAGVVSPRSEPTPPADLFRAARESVPTITSVRAMITRVEEDTPDLLIDPSLALEIVVNLIENAHEASSPEQPLELRAHLSSEVSGRVWVEVHDRGSGLGPEEVRSLRSFEAGDAAPAGLGIELARTLATLSGGSVEWFPRPGGGTIARLDVPAAVLAAEASE